MFAKVEITGVILSKTGLHIGGSDQFSAIGAVDSPVVRDAFTDRPMIPGSTLKGKMRSLLAKQYNVGDSLSGDYNDDDECILRLFGSSQKDHIKRGRFIFSDAFMSSASAESLQKKDIPFTEVKFENNIHRLSAVANPRQIERAVKGAYYNFSLIYNVDDKSEFVEDMQILRDGLTLLEYDYIGGHGSRGYGKIQFKNLNAKIVFGDMQTNILEEGISILKGEDV